MFASAPSTVRGSVVAPRRRLLGATVALLAGLLALPAVSASAASPTPIPRDSHWLTVVNYYRAMAGLNPVRENAAWSEDARLHSCYMLQNGISHDEAPGRPGYTDRGRTAGMNGNVATTSVVDPPARRFVELWLTGPFHAIGLLRHGWLETGYGQCDRSSGETHVRSAATLDVLRGLNRSIPRPSHPILFPGNGTTTSLDRFVNETPNPLDFCGWTGGGGLPVIALMPESFSWANGSITGPAGALQTCTLHRGNTSGIAKTVLENDHGVIVMPRDPLAPGTYTVNVATSARNVTWSFTIDPNVADAPITPAANTAVVGPNGGFVSLDPSRIVDTRSGLGARRLAAFQPVTIQVAGKGGVPVGASAVSANFTASRGSAAGYVTLYPCGGVVPHVSTLNFAPGQIVPNAAIVPLSSQGTVCAVASAPVDLLMDVNGAFTESAVGATTFMTPTRFFDTRTRHRAAGRLPDGGVLTVRITGSGTGVPETATAVVLNVTGVRPSASTFVTAWPADRARPVASNLNLRGGETRANLVVVPLSADGRVSFYTERSTDLFADLVGYVTEGEGPRFSPLVPTRFTDTREARQPLLHAGTNGQRVPGGRAISIPLRGTRGIPTDAKAVAVNVTTVGAFGHGYAAVYPCRASVPYISTVNLQPGATVPNAAVVALSAEGSICVYVSHSTHVVLDVTGYWS